MEIPEVWTERLLLRAFTAPDLDVWNRILFADPAVIRYLPVAGPLTGAQLDGFLERSRSHWAEHGYGTWAVCDASTGELMGDCGLRYFRDIGETEVLYAVARAHWSQGLTTEAARAAVDFGFEQAGLTRIVGYAIPANRASTRVMEKLGMGFEEETDIFGLHCARYAIER